MSEYITKSKQNLYDIALTLYGSIEGIFDLLVSNSDVSLDMVFDKNVKLYYHEDFVINQDIVEWFNKNSLTVRNSQTQINKLNLSKDILQWVDDCNTALSKKYSSGELSEVYTFITKPYPFFDWDVWEDSEEDNTKSRAVTETLVANYFVITDEIIEYAQKISGINLKDMDETNRYDNLSIMFNNGLIVLPSKQLEREAKLDELCSPKILIQQTGKSSSITLEVLNNSFVAIDWGDNSAFEFCSYADTNTNLSHTYNDDGEHTITIYGDNKFINLDLTKINGVYYALSEIYIYHEFLSHYKSAETLNQLFIIKDKR